MQHSATNPWIGFDLDGTLAKQYWPHEREFHPLVIGEPTPLVERVKLLIAQGARIKIFTARVGPRGTSPNNKGLKLRDVQNAIADWTEKHIGVRLEATCVKDFNMIALYDDRAVRIRHNEGVVCCVEPPVRE